MIAGVVLAFVRLGVDTTRVAVRRLLYGKQGGADPRAGFTLTAGGGIAGRTRRAWRRARAYLGGLRAGKGGPVREGGKPT